MKHSELVNKMTLEEKAAILSGKNVWQTRDIKRLNIPSVFCSDGPHGVRKQAGEGDHLGLNASLPSTCFPTAATIANSWDTELAKSIGEALGEEANSLDVNVLLGPGLNIKRNPLCGRNFEYFSEDPYLAGKMAAGYVKGIQSQGVAACPKHFAVNSQELRRMAMNSVIDERTFREIYLTGFEIAVKEGKARTIMSSYNEINGVYANENKHLLTEILRDEWGFDGIVITDWGASNDYALGVKAGSNLEMPAAGLSSARELIEAVNIKRVSMEEVDRAVDQLLDVVLEFTGKDNKKITSFDKKEHHKLARRAAEESIVLMKNKDNILPLEKGTKVAVIGDFAKTPRYQGAGSSAVNPTKVDTFLEATEKSDLVSIGYEQGYSRTGEESEELIKSALDLAAKAEVVIFNFGLTEISESEGLDREHMRISQNQINLLERLLQINPNIVGVMSGGCAVEMPWHHCIKGLLNCYLYGQAGASAVINVLRGKVNPSGKLSETYLIKYEDTPSFRNFPSTERNSEYREGIYIGYRYFDTVGKNVLYPFGFGLSYTTFEYSDIEASEKEVSFTIKNTGKYDGAEVAQVYVGCVNGKIFRPVKELKGFAKVFLKAGEEKRVAVELDDKAFRYWNTATNKWEVEDADYKLMVGASVADIRLEAQIHIDGTTEQNPYQADKLPSYYSGNVYDVKEEEFELLLGHKIPSGKWSGRLSQNDAICQMYYAKSPIARLIYKILTNLKNKSEAKGKPDLNILFIYNMPFRGIAKMTNGMVSMEMVDGMVTVVNGHFFKGMGQIISGFFRNRKQNKLYEKKLEETGRTGR